MVKVTCSQLCPFFVFLQDWGDNFSLSNISHFYSNFKMNSSLIHVNLTFCLSVIYFQQLSSIWACCWFSLSNCLCLCFFIVNLSWSLIVLCWICNVLVMPSFIATSGDAIHDFLNGSLGASGNPEKSSRCSHNRLSQTQKTCAQADFISLVCSRSIQSLTHHLYRRFETKQSNVQCWCVKI